jgi:GxxExxY protein
VESSELTQRIIGAAIQVHRELGPGFLESIYEEALCIALTDCNLQFARQVSIPVRFRGHDVGEHRLDLLVEDAVVVELKASMELHDIHYATLRSYLKATGKELGLLLNFATNALTIRRVGREWHSRCKIDDQARPQLMASWLPNCSSLASPWLPGF